MSRILTRRSCANRGMFDFKVDSRFQSFADGHAAPPPPPITVRKRIRDLEEGLDEALESGHVDISLSTFTRCGEMHSFALVVLFFLCWSSTTYLCAFFV